MCIAIQDFKKKGVGPSSVTPRLPLLPKDELAMTLSAFF